MPTTKTSNVLPTFVPDTPPPGTIAPTLWADTTTKVPSFAGTTPPTSMIPVIWIPVGSPLSAGAVEGNGFGRGISFDETGQRLVVTSRLSARIYELVNGRYSLKWEIEGCCGSNIFFGSTALLSRNGKALCLSDSRNGGDTYFVAVYNLDIDTSSWILREPTLENLKGGHFVHRNGNLVVAPVGDENDDLFQVFEYQRLSNKWTQIGQNLTGNDVVGMSEDGRIVAMRSGDAIAAFEFDDTKEEKWLPKLAIIRLRASFKADLSADGNIIVVVWTVEESMTHIQRYSTQRGEDGSLPAPWVKSGAELIIGIGPVRGITLSGDGNVLAVRITRSRMIRVFEFSEITSQWSRLGEPVEVEQSSFGAGSYTNALTYNGGLLGVGSLRNDDFATNAGLARVFERKER